MAPHVDAAANDPLLAQQWGIFATGADRIWSVTTGKGVTVAVVDSGSGPHPDLAEEQTLIFSSIHSAIYWFFITKDTLLFERNINSSR